jgi:hypothetical protein
VPVIKSNGTNVLIHNTGLASPYYFNGAIRGANVDTLYATGIFDLSGGNVIVAVPEIDQGRYWSFELFDA